MKTPRRDKLQNISESILREYPGEPWISITASKPYNSGYYHESIQVAWHTRLLVHYSY